MNKKILNTLTISLLALMACLFATRTEAAVRIDRPWVKAVAQEQCVPKDAAQAANNCQAEFNTCMSEYERMMDGIFFTFCRGTNPGICNIVGNDVYEFSNMGYGNMVVNPTDRFLFTDPSVKAAYACSAKKKSVEIYSKVDAITAQALIVDVAESTPARDYLRDHTIDLKVQAVPPTTNIPIQPEDNPDVIPVQEDPLTKTEIPVQLENNPDVIPVGSEVTPPAEPSAPSPVKDGTVNPGTQATNSAPEKPVADSNSTDLGSTPETSLIGGGCTLQSTAPSSWVSSLLTVLVFGLFPLIKTRKC